jgi:hypothetical protein
MSQFETEEDRDRRYMWTAEDGVEVTERGTGEDIDLNAILLDIEEYQKTEAQDGDGEGVRRVVQGMDVVIETARGDVRRGFDEEQDREWEQVMPYDYGYLRGIQGADGDSMDVMLGSNPRSSWVYVMDQRMLPPNQREFDEHKVMLGYDSQKEALSAYRRGHHRAKDVLMDWTPMHINDFKHWLKTANLTQPCSKE